MTPFAMEVAISITHMFTNNSLKVYGGDLAIGAMTALTSIYWCLWCLCLIESRYANYNIIQLWCKIWACKENFNIIYHSVSCHIVIWIFSSTSFPRSICRYIYKDSDLMDIAVRGISLNLITLPIMGISIVGPGVFCV